MTMDLEEKTDGRGATGRLKRRIFKSISKMAVDLGSDVSAYGHPTISKFRMKGDIISTL